MIWFFFFFSLFDSLRWFLVVPPKDTFTLHLTVSLWKINFNFQIIICPSNMWQTFASNMYVAYGLVIKHLQLWIKVNDLDTWDVKQLSMGLHGIAYVVDQTWLCYSYKGETTLTILMFNVIFTCAQASCHLCATFLESILFNAKEFTIL